MLPSITPAEEATRSGQIKNKARERNQCVLLPKESTLHYTFSILKGGDARFTLASLPDYAGNKGNQQVSIRIDQGEPVIISLHDDYNSSL